MSDCVFEDCSTWKRLSLGEIAELDKGMDIAYATSKRFKICGIIVYLKVAKE